MIKYICLFLFCTAFILLGCERVQDIVTQEAGFSGEPSSIKTIIIKPITDINIPAGSIVKINIELYENESYPHDWIHYSIDGQSISKKIEILKVQDE